MGAYTNVDDAFESAVKNIATIGEAQGWNDTQLSDAQLDAEYAYDEASDLGSRASAYWDSVSLLDFSGFGYVTGGSNLDESAAKQAKEFWETLYKRAKSNWSGYPNGAKAIDWVGSAIGAAATAVETVKANSVDTIVAGGVKGTAEDLGDIAGKAGNVASNPYTWYGLAAAAALGGLIYVKTVFRL